MNSLPDLKLDIAMPKVNSPKGLDLGDRMKEYENVTRFYLPRRTHTIIRFDGRSFHNFTKELNKPYDEGMRSALVNATLAFMEDAQGAALAFVQSDEISILLQDFAQLETEAWFGGNIQKIVSVGTSIITAHFNRFSWGQVAYFDGRVFTIPDINEVANYFLWRARDCRRNAISMVGQMYLTPSELHGVRTVDIPARVNAKRSDVNFDKLDPEFLFGTVIVNNAKGRKPWESGQELMSFDSALKLVKETLTSCQAIS